MKSWRRRAIAFHLFMTLMSSLVVFLFFQSIQSDTPRSPDSQSIQSARYTFRPDYQPTPPQADAAWKTVDLPHRTDTMGLGPNGYSWYAFELTVLPHSNVDSIYIPRVAANAEVFVDGKPIGMSGHLQGESTERKWNRPIAIVAIPELRSPGTHTVAIQVRMYQSHLAGISTLWVGPAADVRAAWLSRMFNQVGMLIASTALMIGAAVVLLILSLLPPTRRPYLALLILACLLWVVRSYAFLILDAPIDYQSWIRLTQFCLFAFFFVIFYLTIRFCDYPERRPEKIIFAVCLISSPLLAFAPGPQFLTMVGVFGTIGMLGCLRGAWLLIQKGNQLQNLTIHGFAWGMGSLFLLSLNDLLLLLGVFDFDWYFLNQYMGFLLFLALAYFMSYEYARMLREARHFNAHLQNKLNEQALHLRAKHEALQHIEMQKVQLAERQRLMADMHDGLGAHLVSAIHQLRNESIPRSTVLDMLQDGLRDLQLTVDSLEPIENDLTVLVGAFRYRISPSLNASNIQLHWKVASAIPKLSQLNPQMGLMVLRILQETFTNILKHSNASEVTFILEQIGQNICLEIIDNGVGFDVASTSHARGKGLGNMQYRASQIGATLQFKSAPNQGTRIEMALPVGP